GGCSGVWSVIRGLVAEGVTVLLTTQYRDEADQLADRIAVVDHGRVIAGGTPAELQRLTGGARLEATLSVADHAAVDALRPLVEGPFQISEDGRHLRAPGRSTARLRARVVRGLDAAGVDGEGGGGPPTPLQDRVMRLTDA